MSSRGSVYKRGNTWWVSCTLRGRRVRRSSGSHRKTDAIELLQRLQGQARRGRFPGEGADRVTFEDLAEGIIRDYKNKQRKSTKRLRSSLKQLTRYFGGARAVEITASEVERYVALRLGEGAAPATVKKETAALRRMFSLAVHYGKLEEIPKIEGPVVKNTRIGFFDDPTLERVIQALPDHLRGITRAASLIGWRKSELVDLKWENVDFQHGTIRLNPGATKNGAGREVPITHLPELTEVFQRQKAYTTDVAARTGRESPWVFHREGRKLKCFRTAWANACEAAGVPGRWFHDLRRTAVRNFERAGVSRSVAMKFTGHKSLAVYDRYAVTDTNALQEGLVKLDEFRRSQSGAQ